MPAWILGLHCSNFSSSLCSALVNTNNNNNKDSTDGADILFMLDGSEGVSDQAFKDLKKFVSNQHKLYNISSDTNRIGMMVIGDNKQFTGFLDNLVDIQYRMTRLEKAGGLRRVEDTMNEVLKYWLSYFRDDKDHVIVLFLHGRNARDGVDKLSTAAKKLRGKHSCFHIQILSVFEVKF